MKTFVTKPREVQRNWLLIDAAGRPAGRIAAETAKLLRGKHKPTFSPSVDCGDNVIIINAGKAVLTGASKPKERIYRHTGYPGGIKSISRAELLAKRPVKYLERLVKGMLPHTALGRDMFIHVRVFEGEEHPHEAQSPQPWKF
ncbi:MAG TPA: 50S ribosomal protein L13 [Armatimonadota bacterium]|jgi:large subunit ribosomal protein L13